MISAEEARKESESVNTEACRDQISNVNNSILRATNLGETRVCINYHLLAPVKVEMERLGYIIELGSQHNEPYTNISWAS